MSSLVERISEYFPEASDRTIKTTLTDENGGALSLASARLTLCRDSGLTLRDDIEVKDVNGGTYDAVTGVLSIALTPADNVIENSANRTEVQRGLLTLTASGGKQLHKRFDYVIENFSKVP